MTEPHDPLKINPIRIEHLSMPEVGWWLSLTQEKRRELHPKMVIDIEQLKKLYLENVSV